MSNKDAFYFPHDSNARTDPKVIRLRRLSGLAGYGLFWCVVEMLRDAPGYRLEVEMIEDIVFELRTDGAVFDALFSCGLLERDEKHFWSASLQKRMNSFEEKREQARAAGRASAAKRGNENSTPVQQPFNDRSTTVQPKRVKEIKEEDIKEEDITPPSSPISENASTAIESSSDRNELAAALGKIQVSDAELLTWQQLKKLKCTIADVAAARKKVGKNSLNYLKNSVCEERDKRAAQTQGVDLEEYFGKGTKLQ